MEEMTIPCIPDEVIRRDALAMACDFASDPDHAMAIADMFANYIDNGGGTVRVECSGPLAKVFGE